MRFVGDRRQERGILSVLLSPNTCYTHWLCEDLLFWATDANHTIEHEPPQPDLVGYLDFPTACRGCLLPLWIGGRTAVTAASHYHYKFSFSSFLFQIPSAAPFVTSQSQSGVIPSPPCSSS